MRKFVLAVFLVLCVAAGWEYVSNRSLPQTEPIAQPEANIKPEVSARSVTFSVTFPRGDTSQTIQGKLVCDSEIDLSKIKFADGWFWDSATRDNSMFRVSVAQSSNSHFKPFTNPKRLDRESHIELSFPREIKSLFAFNEKEKTGALVILGEQSNADEIVLKMEPLVEVKGGLARNGARVDWSKGTWYVGKVPVAGYYFKSYSSNKMQYWLPPGDYDLHLRGTNSATKVVPVMVSDESSNLGTVELFPALTSKDNERPLFWDVIDASGVDKNVKLEDYRGKWVFLEFWGHW